MSVQADILTGGPGGYVRLDASAYAYMAGLGVSAGVGAGAAVTKSVIKKSNNSKNKPHTVYGLEDAEHKIQYVGRTTDLVARTAAHNANPARAGLKVVIFKEGLTYEEARGIEQTYMKYHHTINTKNAMNNQINGISKRNIEKAKNYLKAAKGKLGYEWNRVSNEVLYWIEN